MSRRRALLPRDVLGDTERERQTMRVYDINGREMREKMMMIAVQVHVLLH